jgi:hypothetical protein
MPTSFGSIFADLSNGETLVQEDGEEGVRQIFSS